VVGVCRKVRMSRQNFYTRRRERKRREVEGELVTHLVRQERQIQPRLGVRKLHYMLGGKLVAAGVKLGRDRFFDLLRGEDLLVERLPREYVRTTCSSHDLPVFPNLTQGLEVKGAHEVLVADVTYVRTEEGFVFLSLVTDKGSRKIVGHHCGESLAASGCVQALEMALSALPQGAHPIHHSDRGTQYCSHQYVACLSQRGLPISMTEKNHCAENALAERMNGILKGEYGLGGCLKSKAQARRAVEQSVRIYNERRPHTSLGYKTPQEAHSLVA
jgi:putative transposase